MELEIKSSIADRAALEQRLRTLGATPEPVRHQRDTYYSPQHIRYYDGGFYCRIRENLDAGTAELAYHVRVKLGEGGQYGSEEFEVTVGNAETLREILRRLEFREECVIEKVRTPWKHGEFEIVIDEVAGLGMYVEVELIAEGTKENYDRVVVLNSALGIDPSAEIPRMGYPDMWRERYGAH